MINERVNTPESRPNDGYLEFEQQIKETLKGFTDQHCILVRTDVSGEDLWDVYINNIPEEDGARQHYTCNACKYFITRYGSIAIVNTDGSVTSALWNPSTAPKFFNKSAKALKKIVEKAPVKNILLVDDKVLGIPKTGEWTHISAELPARYSAINTNRLKTAKQVLAEKKEEVRLLSMALNDFDEEIIQQAIDLLESDSLYRGNRFVDMVQWFKGIKVCLRNIKGTAKRHNLLVLLASSAPSGAARIKNTVVGELMYNLKEGMSTTEVINKFNAMMDPSRYMRAQSDPSVNAVAEAEKVIESLGLAPSLERRYLKIEEIPEEEVLWRHRHTLEKDKIVTAQPLTAGGVFGGVLNKVQASKPKTRRDDVPATKMTWEKFKKTILPNILTMEAKIDNPNKLMALVTAVYPERENILQWSNPVSWYYHGGIDSEMKKRVEEAGGRYEDNKIRCSLMWNSYTDLDLHCITPRRSHIYYGSKQRDGGYLDVDMNVSPTTQTPVENIRWKDSAPNGRYQFYVHNYTDRNNRNNPFKVELQVGSTILTYEGILGREGDTQIVFEFDYRDGQIVNMLTTGATLSNSESWNVEDNSFVSVDLVTTSPNLWGDNNLTQFGEHTFFILDGCKDTSEGKGRGFFNETLIKDLYPIRKTLEAYTSVTPIQGVDEATACGLGFSNNSDWDLTLRVRTKDGGIKIIKIDRLD